MKNIYSKNKSLLAFRLPSPKGSDMCRCLLEGGCRALRHVYRYGCYQKQNIDNCALLGFHTPSNGSFILIFWYNLQVPSSRIQRSYTMGSIGRAETSVRNHNSALCKIPKDHRSHLHRGRSLHSPNGCRKKISKSKRK